MADEDTPTPRIGRPPGTTRGVTPIRHLRVGQIWNDCAKQAKTDGQSMSEFVRDAITRELDRRRALAAGRPEMVSDRLGYPREVGDQDWARHQQRGGVYTTPGARHCRCKYLGPETPEHDASALCLSLRPDADRDADRPQAAVDLMAALKASFPRRPDADRDPDANHPCTKPDRSDCPMLVTAPAACCVNAGADRDPEHWLHDLAREHLSPEALADRAIYGNRSVPDGPRGFLTPPPAGPAPFEVEIKGLPVDPEQAPQPRADHPHTDPGDGRTECDRCGKFVWQVTHSCKGVPVTPAARARWDAAHPEPSDG